MTEEGRNKAGKWIAALVGIAFLIGIAYRAGESNGFDQGFYDGNMQGYRAGLPDGCELALESVGINIETAELACAWPTND